MTVGRVIRHLAPMAGTPRTSMRPRHAPRIGKIVRIGDDLTFRLLGTEYPIGDAMLLAIGDRLLLRGEAQPNLLLHIAGARPSHQRLDLLGLGRLEIEHPELGACR